MKHQNKEEHAADKNVKENERGEGGAALLRLPVSMELDASIWPLHVSLDSGLIILSGRGKIDGGDNELSYQDVLWM
jgi:hypothetical protein